jgi:uncharacterized protein HemY
MSNFFNSLVENKKQKFIAFIYIVALVGNWLNINNHNGYIRGNCARAGHDCYSLVTTSLIVTVIFLVITSLLKNRKTDQ